MSSAAALLMRQLAELQEKPTDGFSVQGIADGNILKWRVVVFGPPDTHYEGGTFLAQLDFPNNYPQRPPKMRFLSNVLHPNIYRNGFVCISILHEPGDGPFGVEKASERWQPIHTVESIVISVQSLLSEPNFKSPANLEASVMFRKNPEEYNEKLRECVKLSNETFEKEGQSHTDDDEARVE
uniref:UBC core domain-containing protein n=1 Tax=Globodera rostochiensis TaxID=31243 RepID=A0A914HHY0_GLORO